MLLSSPFLNLVKGFLNLVQGDEGPLGVPHLTKDRTKWTWYQCPASTGRTCTCIYFLRCWCICQWLLWFLLTCSLYFYCCWFICQWLLWFIWTWQGAKPRTPINKLSNKFVSCLFACYRIQFLPDHIMIHSCLVWFLWWLRHGAIGTSEATPVGVNVDWLDFRIYTF